MDKLGDIELFVNVVNSRGLASAGRKMGVSPASVTARLNRLESSYGVRLLTRTTRQVSLTDEGAVFYEHCLRILREVSRADESLSSKGGELSGNLRITAAIDIGKQFLAPAVTDFVAKHPGVTAHLCLVDHVVNLVEGDFDLALRFGGLSDNRMIARKLLDSRRVMFASPTYIEKYGEPRKPDDLSRHRCLVIEREDQALRTWHFKQGGRSTSVHIKPALSCNDGSLIREWALQGEGIALKSYLDIKEDLQAGRLVTLMDEYHPNYFTDGLNSMADLYVVYPSKNYLPQRVSSFIELLRQYADRM